MIVPHSPIRVLIVDDSPLARDLIRCILAEDRAIEVVGEAADGSQAVAMTARLKPDIVTMDIHMPVMGGLEAIEKIMAETPLPILVLTAQGDAFTAFSAISRGALEVVEKPDISQASGSELLKKIRLLSGVPVARRLRSATAATQQAAVADTGRHQPGIIGIAASTGGPQAINAILSKLPESFAVPILVAQHIADGFARGLAEWLDKTTPLSVSVARNGEQVAAGRVYVNPPECSMRVTPQGQLILRDRDHAEIYNPCCNTMLKSVADAYGKRGVGVILSGMGDDGASGVRAIRGAGGTTFAQDEGSSLIYGMNRLAVEQGGIDRVLSLTDLPRELVQFVSGKGWCRP